MGFFTGRFSRPHRLVGDFSARDVSINLYLFQFSSFLF